MKVYYVDGYKKLGYFTSMKKAVEAIKKELEGHKEYAGYYYNSTLRDDVWYHGEEHMEKVLRAGGRWGWFSSNCYLRNMYYVKQIEVK